MALLIYVFQLSLALDAPRNTVENPWFIYTQAYECILQKSLKWTKMLQNGLQINKMA